VLDGAWEGDCSVLPLVVELADEAEEELPEDWAAELVAELPVCPA